MERRHVRTAWLFLAPMLVVLALVAAWPLVRTLFFGFTNATLIDMDHYEFIGLANFLAREDGQWFGLLTYPQSLRALRNTLLFAVVSVSIETVLGVAIALAVNAHLPGRALMRAAMLVPWAIPTVVSAKMWAWMLHDQFGVVNDLLMGIGVIDAPVAWLGSAGLAMASLIAVDVWKATPFVAMLVLAALQTLPRDCYEAARVDSIGPVKLFFRVTLPLIRPALVVAVIFRLLDALRMFDLAYVLTGANEGTMTLSVHAREQLVSFQDVGYGSASSTALFFIIVLVTALYVAMLKPLGRRS
jgi:trehalose/maltose transport system permease protein